MVKRMSMKMLICLILGILAQPVYSQVSESAGSAKSGEISQVSFPDIVDKVQKSIVGIMTVKAADVRFDKEGNPKFNKVKGFGSGIIINPEGYILTCESVINNNPEKILVVLYPERKEMDAKLIGSDKRNNLAILKIESPSQLTPAILGDSDKMRIGEQVGGIGSEVGNLTATLGIINAKREGVYLPQGSLNTDVLQTDVHIAPGFMGGALINMQGEVIGVLYTQQVEGVGYAISINSTKRVIDAIIKQGKVTYGWIGIRVQDVDEGIARYNVLPDNKGALVYEVLKDSPAQKAGFKNGDVIRIFDGNEVKSSRELIRIVGKIDIGKKVKVKIIRDKSEKEIEVEVGERPEEKESVPVQKSETKQDVPIIGGVPVVGKIRRVAMADGYTITVESDGSFLLRFPPNNESDVAGCLDQIFHEGPSGNIQFVPGVDTSALQKLEDEMHDRNFSISTRFGETKDGQGIISWTLHRTPEKIGIYIQSVEKREVRRRYHDEIETGATDEVEAYKKVVMERRHRDVISVSATDLGKHIQVGQLQVVDKETMRVTVYFDEDGKDSLRDLIAKGAGQKLSLMAEGVAVGEGVVPQEGDGASLTFTLISDKLERLKHAFEMSGLQLIKSK